MVSEAQKRASKKYRDGLARIDIHVDKSLKAAVDKKTKEQNISLRNLIIRSLENYVNE